MEPAQACVTTEERDEAQEGVTLPGRYKLAISGRRPGGEGIVKGEVVVRDHPLSGVDERLPTRQRILITLKMMGEASTQQLATRLGMTAMGVRRHLYALEAAGVIAHRVVRYGQGRPRFVYFLTPEGHHWFAQRYAALSLELLTYLAELYGEEAVALLFERRARRRVEEASRVLGDLPVEERVAALAELLDREGYLAVWHKEGPGQYCLCEHHCAIHDVAVRFPQACVSELKFIQALFPEASVERVRHLVQGHYYCAYRIVIPGEIEEGT